MLLLQWRTPKFIYKLVAKRLHIRTRRFSYTWKLWRHKSWYVFGLRNYQSRPTNSFVRSKISVNTFAKTRSFVNQRCRRARKSQLYGEEKKPAGFSLWWRRPRARRRRPIAALCPQYILDAGPVALKLLTHAASNARTINSRVTSRSRHSWLDSFKYFVSSLTGKCFVWINSTDNRE